MNVLQNCYPRFAKNRILKKEMLEALRDYSFACAQLEYQNYGQGILCGCDIRDDKMRFMDWTFNGRTGCTLWSGGANAVFKAFGERKGRFSG